MWEWISNAANTVGNWISDAANWVGDTFFGGSHQTNVTNANIANQNLQFQKEANDQNIAFQKWANEYNVEAQKWMNEQNINFQTRENEITRAREDNAVQRAVADMTAAGLSKTLAAGHPASASALSAPQVSAPQVSAPQMQALNNSYKMQRNLAGLNMLNQVRDVALKMREDQRAEDLNAAQIRLLKEQADYVKANAIGQNNSNNVFMENHENEVALTESQIALNNANRDYNFARTELEKINGNYRAKFLESEIEQMIANRKFLDMGTKERAQSIAESIARENNLNRQSEKLIEDIAFRKLEMEILGYNFEYSKEHSLRTTDQTNRVLGINMSSFADNLKEGLKLDPDSFAGKMWHNLNSPIWEWQWPF